jgi:hypothetical protein
MGARASSMKECPGLVAANPAYGCPPQSVFWGEYLTFVTEVLCCHQKSLRFLCELCSQSLVIDVRFFRCVLRCGFLVVLGIGFGCCCCRGGI